MEATWATVHQNRPARPVDVAFVRQWRNVTKDNVRIKNHTWLTRHCELKLGAGQHDVIGTHGGLANTSCGYWD